jgi:hypothetical protein
MVRFEWSAGPVDDEQDQAMGSVRFRREALAAVLLVLLAIGSTGCDDIFRDAADFFDDVADTLDGVADDWDDDHRDCGDVIDDVFDDIEDWFD